MRAAFLAPNVKGFKPALYKLLAVGYEKYDIVTANILADVLVPLTPVIVHQMKPGGLYITSGILDVKEEVVKEAVTAAGLEIVEVTHQGEWVSVTARKLPSPKAI